jgi:hypothetical protein
MSLSTINLIDSNVRRASNAAGLDGSPEASQKLVRDIAARVKNGMINIRIVIRGDNLGRIAEGLSRGEVKLLDEGGSGWENIPVVYLGPSPRIHQQKEYNPDCTLIKALLIHPGQYVTFNKGRVYVSDTVEQILTALE